ncbi:MAG: uncharacterized protein A8A55_0495 [Amphiamblys sp. WSBS2006]|nr:MAG: uncharacterized protein A8A55_0495 [Amphiamblys sp. WSBS2006]
MCSESAHGRGETEALAPETVEGYLERKIAVLKAIQEIPPKWIERTKKLFFSSVSLTTADDLSSKAAAAFFISDSISLYEKSREVFRSTEKNLLDRAALEESFKKDIVRTLNNIKTIFYTEKERAFYKKIISNVQYYTALLQDSKETDERKRIGRVFGITAGHIFSELLDHERRHGDRPRPLGGSRRAAAMAILGPPSKEMLNRRGVLSDEESRYRKNIQEMFFLYLERLQKTDEGVLLCKKSCFFLWAGYKTLLWVFGDKEKVKEDLFMFVGYKSTQSYYKLLFLLDLLLETMGDVLSFEEKVRLVDIHWTIIDVLVWERESSAMHYTGRMGKESTYEADLKLLYTVCDHHTATMGKFFHRVRVCAMYVLGEIGKKVPIDNQLERKWKSAFVKLCRSGYKMRNIFKKNGLGYTVGFVLYTIVQKNNLDINIPNMLAVLKTISRISPGPELRHNIELAENGKKLLVFDNILEEGTGETTDYDTQESITEEPAEDASDHVSDNARVWEYADADVDANAYLFPLSDTVADDLVTALETFNNRHVLNEDV